MATTVRVQGRPGQTLPPGVNPAAPGAPTGDPVRDAQRTGTNLQWDPGSASGAGTVGDILAANAARNQASSQHNVQAAGLIGRILPSGQIPASVGLGAGPELAFLRDIDIQARTIANISQQQASRGAGVPWMGGTPPMPGGWPAGTVGGGGGGRPPPPGFGGWGGLGGAGGGPGGPGMPLSPGFAGGGGGLPPGGGGGFGGGGGGGGGNVPPGIPPSNWSQFAGQIGSTVGLGSTARLMTGGAGGMSMSGAAGLGFEAGMELFFLPQTIANLEARGLSAGRRAIDYVRSTSVMGQAGGFNSVDLRERMRSPANDQRWLEAGMAPDEVMAMVSQLGVVPRSAEEGVGAGRLMARSRIEAGTSNIPAGMYTSVMRDMMGIGVTSFGGMSSTSQDIGAIMKQTAQTGQDQLKVLMSIDRGVVSLSTSPGAVAPIDPGTLFQTNQRFIGSAAGMAGIAGERSITETQNAWSRFGASPATTIIGTQQVGKLRSENDLRNYFGADAWDKFVATDTGRTMANAYLHDMRNNNTYGAGLVFSEGFMKDPTLAASSNAQMSLISNPVTRQGGAGGGLELKAQANVSGRSMSEVIQMRQSQNPGMATGTAAQNPLNLMYANQPNAIGSHAMSGGRNLAVFPNMAEGIAASVKQLQLYESRDKLSTTRQLVQKWEGGHASDAYVNAVAKSIGVAPDVPINMFDPETARQYVAGAAPQETGAAGARLSRADINSGVAIAFGQEPSNPNMRAGGSDPNIPGFNPSVSRVGSDVLNASERSLRQLDNAMGNLEELRQGFSAGWNYIKQAVDGLSAAVKAAETTVMQSLSGSPSSTGAPR